MKSFKAWKFYLKHDVTPKHPLWLQKSASIDAFLALMMMMAKRMNFQ